MATTRRCVGFGSTIASPGMAVTVDTLGARDRDQRAKFTAR